MQSVVDISFNVKEGEGVWLSEQYKVGKTYPVFILTDAEGEIIYRWTGFTGAPAFISSLKRGLSDLTTIKDRISQFESKPTYNAALTLARYFEEAGEYLDAVKFYKRAVNLNRNPGINYSWQIFSNSANAAWNGLVSFEMVLPSADSILYGSGNSRSNMIRMAKAMSRLTRKLGKEDRLRKYLQAGIDITSGAKNPKDRNTHSSLLIDYALQIQHDTSGALSMKKRDMGEGWKENPEQFYNFAKWCLERKVNLAEAETLARSALQYAKDGEFKASVYYTTAEICFERGDLENAIVFIGQAMKQDPGNTIYMDAQDKYLENWGKK